MQIPKASIPSEIPTIFVAIAIPVVSALGSMGGAYFNAHEAHSETPKAQYELWSPSSLNPKSPDLVIFKIDKISGNTWQYIQTGDTKTNRLQWMLITPSDSK